MDQPLVCGTCDESAGTGHVESSDQRLGKTRVMWSCDARGPNWSLPSGRGDESLEDRHHSFWDLRPRPLFVTPPEYILPV